MGSMEQMVHRRDLENAWMPYCSALMHCLTVVNQEHLVVTHTPISVLHLVMVGVVA